MADPPQSFKSRFDIYFERLKQKSFYSVIVVLVVSIIAWGINTISATGSQSDKAPQTQKLNVVKPNGRPDPDSATGPAEIIKVGLNSKDLKGNEVSVFSDCNPQMDLGNLLWLTNENDVFYPTILVRVVRVVERRDNTSDGCMFISKEATKRMDIFSKRAGIVHLKVRKINHAGQKMQSKETGASFMPPVELNFSVFKK